MRKQMYEVIFEATETLQNGKERRVRKGILMDCVNPVTNRHTSPEQQIARGEAALKEAYFYNIVYIETKKKTLIFG